MTRLLEQIDKPGDLKRLSLAQLEQLASEIREELVSVVSANGGHLASNLGVVELTITLHRIFDSPHDKIIWDVGHQAYAHKLLTGRREKFATLRQYGGLSGFTCRNESEHDPFGAGHASTSVSAALGMAVARDLAGETHEVVAVIGDGAITGGMALEGLNQAAQLGSRLIVILNDNGMSISPTVGAFARLLDRIRFDHHYRAGKEKSQKIITPLPFGKQAWRAALRVESWIKDVVKPTTIWEDLGFTYMGPVDGHNIQELESALKRAREYKGSILVHVVTVKGKGYQPAEGDAVYFHGIPAKGGSERSVPTYSDVFAQTVLKLMKENPRLVVITPAMPEGNSLNIVQAQFPGRVFDVGICEQHAVTFAAGLATQGYLPIVAIYSTFLQRSFDQIVHDVCLQELPVVFAIDRGGIVGDDGKTHQGAFDLSYLSLIPNLIVASPKDENELQHLLFTATRAGKPMAVRYPRSAGLGVPLDETLREIPLGRGEIVRRGADIGIIAIGSMVAPSMQAASLLAEKGIQATVVNARFAKPLDMQLILDIAGETKNLVTVEENTLQGGFGSRVADLVRQSGTGDVRIKSLGLPDKFIEHGAQAYLRGKYGLDAKGIAREVAAFCPVYGTAKPVRL